MMSSATSPGSAFGFTFTLVEPCSTCLSACSITPLNSFEVTLTGAPNSLRVSSQQSSAKSASLRACSISSSLIWRQRSISCFTIFSHANTSSSSDKRGFSTTTAFTASSIPLQILLTIITPFLLFLYILYHIFL